MKRLTENVVLYLKRNLLRIGLIFVMRGLRKYLFSTELNFVVPCLKGLNFIMRCFELKLDDRIEFHSVFILDYISILLFRRIAFDSA